MKQILDIKIFNLNATIETMNETLNEFRGMLEDQLDAGVDFWQEICKQGSLPDGNLKLDQPMPQNLEQVLFNMYENI
jgi:hypothetical protein